MRVFWQGGQSTRQDLWGIVLCPLTVMNQVVRIIVLSRASQPSHVVAGEHTETHQVSVPQGVAPVPRSFPHHVYLSFSFCSCDEILLPKQLMRGRVYFSS